MNEVNDVAPSSLSHLVGQRSVIEQVRVAIDAAFADNRKFDSAMLVGPPGVGKTALASVVAQEMATDFHDVLGQSIKGIQRSERPVACGERQGCGPYRRGARIGQENSDSALSWRSTARRC